MWLSSRLLPPGAIKQAGNSPQKSFQHPFKNALSPCTQAGINQPNPIRRQRQIGKELSGVGCRKPLWFPHSLPFHRGRLRSRLAAQPRPGHRQHGGTWLPSLLQGGTGSSSHATTHGAHAALLQPHGRPQGLTPHLTAPNMAAVQAWVWFLVLSGELEIAADTRCQSWVRRQAFSL